MALLTQRANLPEIMDNLNFAGQEMDTTLRELEIINKWLGGNSVTLKGIGRALRQVNDKKKVITIADLGCGGGDMLKLMAKWGRKKGYKFKLYGIDANSYIIDYARQNTLKYPEIQYLSLNIFSEEFQKMEFDLITCTLFTHHFDDQELLQLFKQFKHQTKTAVIINDLHRHWFAYHSIKWITRLFSNSPMVQNDAPVSVLRSFRKRELKKLLDEAHIKNYYLQWKWAFRWELVFH